jgi:hypothetical protein
MNPKHAAKQAAHAAQRQRILSLQQQAFERYVKVETPTIAATLVKHGVPWVLVHRMAQDKAMQEWFEAHPRLAKYRVQWEARAITHAVLSEMPA